MRRSRFGQLAVAAFLVLGGVYGQSGDPARAATRSQVVSVNVAVGGARLVRFRVGIERFTVADGAVADAKLVGARSLQVAGKKVGETTVLVWDTRGSPTRLVISVGIATEGLGSRLEAIFPGESIVAQATGNTVVLTGKVSDPVVSERAAKVAEAYLKREDSKAKVLNFLEVKGRQQVQIRVKVAEVSRTALRQMGANIWARGNSPNGHSGGMLAPASTLGPSLTPTVTGIQPLPGTGENPSTPLPIIANPSMSSGFGLFFATGGSALPISIAINMMQGKRLAKVLSEPTLVAYSGQKAEFLAGGEFPFPVAQAVGQQSIEFKKFGVQLSFTPTVLANRTIHLPVSVTVSEPDGAITVGGTVVGLRSRHGQTTVRLRNGQSFAIAGLLQDRVSSEVLKVPLLGDIPILGAFFRQKSFEREERELVILVTAQLVRPLKPGEVPALPGEDEISDPGAVAFFLLGSVDPELKAKRHARPAGPVGYSK